MAVAVISRDFVNRLCESSVRYFKKLLVRNYPFLYIIDQPGNSRFKYISEIFFESYLFHYKIFADLFKVIVPTILVFFKELL